MRLFLESQSEHGSFNLVSEMLEQTASVTSVERSSDGEYYSQSRILHL